MAKKEQKIKAISYVHVGDKLVEFNKLPPEERMEIATKLKITYLNALFAGKAEFFLVE